LSISKKIFRLWMFFIVGIVLMIFLSNAVIQNILGLDTEMFFEELKNGNTKVLVAEYILFIFQQLFVFLFTAVFWVKMYNNGDFADMGIRFRVKWQYVFLSIGIFLLGMPVLEYIIEFNQNISLPDRFSDMEENMKNVEEQNFDIVKAFLGEFSPLRLVINIVALALVPAICEELFFRGALQGVLIKRYGNIHISIWVVAFLFSLFHSSFYGFIPRFLLGALFGYMTIWSGSLIPAMVAHFINNAVSVVGSYILIGGNSDEFMESDNKTIPLLSLILTVGLITMFYRKKVS